MKIKTIDEMLEWGRSIITTSGQLVKQGKEVSPLIILIKGDRVSFLPMSQLPGNTDDDFDNSLRLCRAVVCVNKPDAVAWTMEGWTVRLKKGDPPLRSRVSERPDRLECIMVTVENKHRKLCGLMQIIDRTTNPPTLEDVELTPEGVKAGPGRSMFDFSDLEQNDITIARAFLAVEVPPELQR
jgi:hypothetical protein